MEQKFRVGDILQRYDFGRQVIYRVEAVGMPNISKYYIKAVNGVDDIVIDMEHAHSSFTVASKGYQVLYGTTTNKT